MCENRLFSVDRIVGDMVVLEDEEGNLQNVSLFDLPMDIKPGSVLRFSGTDYVADAEETQARKKRILALQERLKNKL